MTKTPSKPSHPTSSGGQRRPWPPRLFAIGAVLLLVVAGLVVVLSGLMRSSEVDAAERQSAYAAQALERIDALSDLGDAARGRGLEDLTVAQQEIDALTREVFELQAELQRAIDDAAELPPLPVGYLPGDDVTGDLPDVVAGAYEVPDFAGGIMAAAYDAASVAGDASPVTNRTGLHLPPTGTPADDALGQLVGACAEVRDLVMQYGGSLPPLPVPVTTPSDPCAIESLDDLPITDPTGVTGGLDPTGGLLDDLGDGLVPPGLLPTDPTGMLGGLWPQQPSQGVRDANDAVAPDELGADAARLHASAILGTTDLAYGQANRTLTDLLASYQGLADQLDALAQMAKDQAEAATDKLPEVLASRLAEIEGQAESLRAEAARLADAHVQTARAAAAQALGIAQDAVADHLAKLQVRLDAAVAELNAKAKQVVAMAEARKTQVARIVDDAVAELGRMAEDSGVDATSQVAAIEAAGEAAVASLDAQAKAAVESIKQKAVLLQAEAQSAVPRLTAMGVRAEAEINGTLDEAVRKAEAAKVYLTDLAGAWAAKLTEAEETAKAAAEALIETRLEGHLESLKATALAMVHDVPDVVASTSALVDEATQLVQGEVDKSVDYILKVADDYSKVPTEERKARALFWNTVGSLAQTVSGEIDEAGVRLVELADEVVDAAESARAEVEAVAASI